MPLSSNHDFTSLSVRDLLDAREAYHVHLAHLGAVHTLDAQGHIVHA
jgi:hypothetical protein